MDPDQTVPLQSDLGPYCLHYKLLNNTSRREKQTTKVVSGQKVCNLILGWHIFTPLIFVKLTYCILAHLSHRLNVSYCDPLMSIVSR